MHQISHVILVRSNQLLTLKQHLWNQNWCQWICLLNSKVSSELPFLSSQLLVNCCSPPFGKVNLKNIPFLHLGFKAFLERKLWSDPFIRPILRRISGITWSRGTSLSVLPLMATSTSLLPIGVVPELSQLHFCFWGNHQYLENQGEEWWIINNCIDTLIRLQLTIVTVWLRRKARIPSS